MQLEQALGLLLGGMKPPAPADEENANAENADENNNETADLPGADTKTESSMSVESTDSAAEKVTIGKKRRRGSIKKSEGLKLENKDSNLSLDIKVSSKKLFLLPPLKFVLQIHQKDPRRRKQLILKLPPSESTSQITSFQLF